MDKRIAIIIDKEGWAYENTAKQIKKYLSKYYNIEIIPFDIFEDNIVKLLIYITKYDLTLFLWRGYISWLDSDFARYYIDRLGYKYNEFMELYLKKSNIVTAVYDHLFLELESERTDFIINNIKDYYVSSEKLKKIYDNKYEKKPSYVIADGVDLELFKMKDEKKYSYWNKKKLIVGWTGNSKFTDEKDDDLKGVNKIIIPTIEELKKEGIDVELKVADRNIKLIPHEEMPQYYNGIDVYICASRTEGTPNTILEAMACGIPVISTDVGIVPEVFGQKQREFIIKRDKEDLKQKIKILIENNDNILEQLSKENIKQIQKWNWEKKAEIFKEFFDDNLNK